MEIDFDDFFGGLCSAMCFTAHVDNEDGDTLFPCHGEFTSCYDGRAECERLLSADELAELRKDCAGFLSLLKGAAYDEVCKDAEQAGTDFHFTRNGHGAGFWDGEWENGDELTKWAESFGSCELTGQRTGDEISACYLMH